jgi:hypothetical protein
MEADGSDLRLLVDAPAPDDWLQIERAAVSTNIEAIEPLAVKPQIAIPVGQGLLVVSNRKNPDELTFTINTKEIVIAPYQVRNIPLPAGHHLWTASWPSKSGLSGTADIVVGQIAYPIVDR